jgi:CNT family concentrative nucleoside transporter
MERLMCQLRRVLLFSLVLLTGLVTVEVLGAKAAPTVGSSITVPTKTNSAANSDVSKKKKSGQVRLKDLRDNREQTPLFRRLAALLGIAVLIAIAWGISRNRKAIRWRTVAWGIALQVVFGMVVLSPKVGGAVFDVVNKSVSHLLSFAEKGNEFVFGTVEEHEVTLTHTDRATGKKVKTTKTVDSGKISSSVKTIAFVVLPMIIFFSALMNLLYYLGIVQPLVRGVAWVMQRTMKTSGAESLSAAANIFVGQTEAPLVIRPFVDKMTDSELNAVMVGGFATVAGGVMAIYVIFLENSIPDIAGHLVVASIMSAPAALAIAKIIYPETEKSETAGGVEFKVEKDSSNAIEAVARGSATGMKLFLNVLAMLIAFVGIVALLDGLLGLVGSGLGYIGWEVDLSLTKLLSYVFAPLAWCMGVPWGEAGLVGELLGEKIVLTELLAYKHLGGILADGELSYRSAVISAYALCGFANFASIGIQIGGIGGIAPGRIKDVAKLGLLAMIGGVLAANMTATVAGIIL